LIGITAWVRKQAGERGVRYAFVFLRANGVIVNIR